MAERRSRAPSWFIYVVRCSDGTLYTGIAIDVAARILAHARGKGAKYTRGRGPFTLKARAKCGAMGDAMRVERAFKALSKKEKLVVITSSRRLASFAKRVREERTS
jgi:predicted GIY-YIG superfamily endonuclease